MVCTYTLSPPYILNPGHYLVLDPSQEVFSVKHVTVIPLTEIRANDALKTLAARHNADPRSSLVPASSVTMPVSLDDVPSGSDSRGPDAPRVTFAEEEQVKIMTPRALEGKGFEHSDDEYEPETGASSPSDSVASTPSSEFSVMTGNIAKTLADRLSFWNKMGKKPASGTPTIEQTLADDSEQLPSHSRRSSIDERTSLDAIIKQGDRKPSEILDAMVEAQSSAPATVAQKNSELEEKIIKEVVHQFVKGGMYFAYRFGTLSKNSWRIPVTLSCRHYEISTTKARTYLAS